MFTVLPRNITAGSLQDKASFSDNAPEETPQEIQSEK